MTTYDHDWIVVGFGLAGAAVAWRLIEAGERVLVVDPGEAVTSSKIAAGLITPITGKNLALAWTNERDRIDAEAFYRRIETVTGAQFFHTRTALRLFADADERERWLRRRDKPEFRAHLLDPQPVPLLDPTIARVDAGGFAMRGAQVDVMAYLTASAAKLARLTAHLDWQRDVRFDDDGVTVLGRRARGVISCEGHAATRNPYLDWIPFRAARGEILTLQTAQPMPPMPLHRGIWVAPSARPDEVMVGATFAWTDLDSGPTDDGRQELTKKLGAFFHAPHEVIGHHAAVRPIIEASRLAIGIHPHQPRLAIFNGLASKGVLRAPIAAAHLVARLLHGTPIPREHDVARFPVTRPLP